ncbi:MAG: 50S ribosomal protein L24 [Treponema sp.]|jgi:large subunit ribosomal protein L24|nr:50S ribosomal protein L24 [Treponema sp.]
MAVVHHKVVPKIQHKFKVKKDDIVQVIAGKDKGKRGRILKILREKDRIIVEGVNIVKKAKKRRNQQDRGGIIEIEAAIHSSNLMIVCKKCGQTRIGYQVSNDSKIRVCKKCGEVL